MRSYRSIFSARAIYSAVLIVVILVQLGLLLDGYAITQVKRIWRLRAMSAYQRSAMFAFGEDFLQYMEFVTDTVPTDATVVIPKEAQGGMFGHVGIMQFFLFPRRIVDCPLESVPVCLGLGKPDFYILSIDSRFPPRDVSLEPKLFVPFEGERGVLVPMPTE